MPRVAIYARVSTRDKGQETSNQTNAMKSFIPTQKDWTLTYEYIDHDTGTSSDRDQFQQMLHDASTRKFDILIFWALDRFCREGTAKTLHYLNQLDNYGVSFRSFTEPYLDSCGIFRDVVISMLATLAKQEVVRLRERIKAGLARAKMEGRVPGPKQLDGTGMEKIMQKIQHEGMSYRQIGRELGVSRGTVERRVKEWRKLQGERMKVVDTI